MMLPMLRCRLWPTGPFRPLACALGLALAPTFTASASITGVCPDGSVFVVRRAADVPCREARQVEPHRVPPLRPENLPRPYLWQVHREKLDQNNPYNLLGRADQVRALGAQDPAPPAGASQPATAAPSAPTTSVAAAPPAPSPPRAPALGLTDGEMRDLFYVVELSQQRALATFVRPGAGGEDSLRVALAHSQAFEARLRGAGRSAGPVLLFSVQSKAAERFQPNFTFVQGSDTFTPRREDPAQLGVVSGSLGDLAANELVLGYVVLPPSIDLAQPLDIYWDDRQLGATFLR